MDKRVKILNAVIKIIEKEGLSENITISSIAKKAGIGKGTVYEYFNSKEEVIGETLIHFIKEKTLHTVDLNSYEKLDFEKSFKKYIDDIITFFEKDKFIFKILNDTETNYCFTTSMRKKVTKQIKKAKSSYKETMMYFLDKGIKEDIIGMPNEFELENIGMIIMSNILRYTHCKDISVKNFKNNLYNLIIKILR